MSRGELEDPQISDVEGPLFISLLGTSQLCLTITKYLPLLRKNNFFLFRDCLGLVSGGCSSVGQAQSGKSHCLDQGFICLFIRVSVLNSTELQTLLVVHSCILRQFNNLSALLRLICTTRRETRRHCQPRPPTDRHHGFFSQPKQLVQRSPSSPTERPSTSFLCSTR